MLRALLFIVLFTFGSAVMAADTRPLQDSMSAEEFKAAGLDKLSAEELAALNAWLNRDRKIVAQQAKEQVKEAAREEAKQEIQRERSTGLDNPGGVARVPVTSKIIGEFIGWRGNTAFELENGQIWIQAESGEMIAKKQKGVSITIKPGMMGSWFLKAQGYNSQVRVKRVK